MCCASSAARATSASRWPISATCLALWRDQGGRARRQAHRARHVAALERKIAEPQGMVDTLRTLAAHCHGDARPDCPILTDLDAGGGALNGGAAGYHRTPSPDRSALNADRTRRRTPQGHRRLGATPQRQRRRVRSPFRRAARAGEKLPRLPRSTPSPRSAPASTPTAIWGRQAPGGARSSWSPRPASRPR